MEKLFLTVLNLSLTSCYVILFVLAVRLLLRRAPKLCSYALWAVVGFRLLCPVTLQSVFSLIPVRAQPIPPAILTAPDPQIQSGLPALDAAVNASLPDAAPWASANPLQVWAFVGGVIWLIGLAALMLYGVISALRLARRLRAAQWQGENLYRMPGLSTAFVFGFPKPRIYLPDGLSEREESYILRHEQTHIRRGDPWIKALAFVALAIHWFNPLVWAAYFQMSRDMEMSCDERVLREMGGGIKKEYSASLLNLAAGHSMWVGGPLAFGESSVKSRIKNVLNYRRPAFWAVVLAALLAVAAGVGLLLNPAARSASLEWAKNLKADQVAKIELWYFPSSPNEMYKEYAPEEFPEIVALLNEARGRRVEDPAPMEGSAQIFHVTMKDGTQHTVENSGNTYLIIDGDHFDAGYDWLSKWNFRGDSPEPDATVLDQWERSVHYNSETGELVFTIPQKIPGKLFLHVSGRLNVGMSWHAFEEESGSFGWEPGKTYSTQVWDIEYLELTAEVLADGEAHEGPRTLTVEPDGFIQREVPAQPLDAMELVRAVYPDPLIVEAAGAVSLPDGSKGDSFEVRAMMEQDGEEAPRLLHLVAVSRQGGGLWSYDMAQDQWSPLGGTSQGVEDVSFRSRGSNLQELGRDACAAYLESLMSAVAPVEQRIAGYEVVSVRPMAGTPEEFSVWAEYRYDTADPNFRNPGDGASGLGSWSAGRMLRAKRTAGDQYELISVGTGGGTEGLALLQRDYYVMLVDPAPYGTDVMVFYGGGTDEEYLSQMASLNGFAFTQEDAAGKQLEFVFMGEEPDLVELRCYQDGGAAQTYAIGADGRLACPQRPGVYRFLADITWPDGCRETACFKVTVTE